jgi:hypothetical protein
MVGCYESDNEASSSKKGGELIDQLESELCSKKLKLRMCKLAV